MIIKSSRILILGGWGLVGSAIARKLLGYNPKELIITSLREEEAKEAVEDLKNEFGGYTDCVFTPRWGNLFTRQEWKDISPSDVITDSDKRKRSLKDIFGELDDEVLNAASLYSVIRDDKPDVVIDCINTATGIAYGDIFTNSNNLIDAIDNGSFDEEIVERMMSSVYVPQLIRHVQILYRALTDMNVGMYLKIGTTGTGGMGMNIPYTHSEDRPSRVLMSKTAVAGAHTLLMYLMARTPDGPIVKEIKPAATIAWKRIAYDTLKKGGKAIELVDMNFESAKPTTGNFDPKDSADVNRLGETYKSVFIDTGENGIFSKGEFQAISSLGQMEIVTPEEIADYAVFEINGGNTGKDVIQGLDAFALGPTYRGGFLQNKAIEKIQMLEKEHNVESIAFELLGPPRLSKLLYEAYLINRIAGTFANAIEMGAETISQKANEFIKLNANIRSQILSIGLPILLADGKYLRGEVVKIPARGKDKELEFSEHNIEQWCYNGWIDLRETNFEQWLNRFKAIMEQTDSMKGELTSSRYFYTKDYWDNFDSIDGGKIAGWIFEFEDKGWRFKR